MFMMYMLLIYKSTLRCKVNYSLCISKSFKKSYCRPDKFRGVNNFLCWAKNINFIMLFLKPKLNYENH